METIDIYFPRIASNNNINFSSVSSCSPRGASDWFPEVQAAAGILREASRNTSVREEERLGASREEADLVDL